MISFTFSGRTAKIAYAVFVALSCLGADSPMAKVKEPIRAELLEQVEKELARLEAQAKSESYSNGPQPSSEVAFYLLVGLTANRMPVEQLTPSEQRAFDVEKRGGTVAKLFELTPNVRVSITDTWIQDKALSFTERRAALYVRRGQEWIRKGQGFSFGRD